MTSNLPEILNFDQLILKLNHFICVWWSFLHRSSPRVSDEMSRMIEFWMNNHLVSDNNCNTVNLKPPPQKNFLQG